jgi:hypothetical protein
MWTDLERVKRMVAVFKEYHDYGHITGDDRWVLSRSTRDVAHRSVGGVDICGWSGLGAYYETASTRRAMTWRSISWRPGRGGTGS